MDTGGHAFSQRRTDRDGDAVKHITYATSFGKEISKSAPSRLPASSKNCS